jgi:homocysteine S-methyltransferase
MTPTPTDVFLLDGATGTELDLRGVDIGLPLWSAAAIVESPEVLGEVHRAYLEAGAQAVTTNTFRTHERSLAKGGLTGRAADLTRRAVSIAMAARDEVNTDAIVLGSVAPLEDCYSPERAPAADICRAEHAQIIAHLVDAGVDVVLLETMCGARESLAAVDAATAGAAGAWAISFCLRSSGPPGVLLDGTPVADLAPNLLGARFVGINCVAATQLGAQVSALRGVLPEAMPIAAYGNVGYANEQGAWVSTDAIEPARYAEYAMGWIDAGASLVGGCCGTSPDTIRAISGRLAARASILPG